MCDRVVLNFFIWFKTLATPPGVRRLQIINGMSPTLSVENVILIHFGYGGWVKQAKTSSYRKCYLNKDRPIRLQEFFLAENMPNTVLTWSFESEVNRFGITSGL